MDTRRVGPAVGVCIVALLVVGCTSTSPEASGSGTTQVPALVTRQEIFGGLTVELVVPASVRSGDSMPSTMVVENRSGHPVTDPGCVLGTGNYGLVPVDDPDGDLWPGPAVDCGGPYTWADGARDEYVGPTFRTWTPTGDPLPPGSYLATLAVEGGRRLQYPVTIEP